MLPNFKILAFFWRQFYSIAPKKKLSFHPSFFHTGAEIKKKREDNEVIKG